ncbi:MAG TPA: mersacidin/lichenicidin family type 2 lantibiotic [Thermoanaerobaculia bacterium]|nr:mersacidin/lichenicidin family type 2 lantibiotic [Thermoanaerobaculia bacterium]
MMKMEDVIRAWKDADFRESLSPEQKAALPDHPAGVLAAMSPEELAQVSGGGITVSSWVCGVIVSVTVCDELVEFFNNPPEGGGSGGKGYCFTAGTPVQVPGGARAIETLAYGDRILAFDAAAGQVREARVAGLDVHDVTSPLLSLRTSGERIEVTPGHRFHGRDGWLPVESLGGEGRCLDLREKATPVALQGARLAEGARVYNVRVEGLGSYFVGNAGLLVRDC